MLRNLSSFPQHTGAHSLERTIVEHELQVCSQNSSPRSYEADSNITYKNVSRGLDWALGKWLWQRSPISKTGRVEAVAWHDENDLDRRSDEAVVVGLPPVAKTTRDVVTWCFSCHKNRVGSNRTEQK